MFVNQSIDQTIFNSVNSDYFISLTCSTISIQFQIKRMTDSAVQLCWLSRTISFSCTQFMKSKCAKWKLKNLFRVFFFFIFGIFPLFVHSLRAAFRASIWCFYADAHVHQIAWKDRKRERDRDIVSEEKTLHQYKPACITIQFDENCKSANNGNWTDESSEMQARKRKIAF